MSNARLIKKYFDFLKRDGFRRKVIARNGDVEIAYSNNSITIEICCELGIQYVPISNSSNIADILNNSGYFVIVVIKYGYQGGNILYCDLFDKQIRIKLKSDIDSAGNDIELILRIYSQFVKDNIMYIK